MSYPSLALVPAESGPWAGGEKSFERKESSSKGALGAGQGFCEPGEMFSAEGNGIGIDTPNTPQITAQFRRYLSSAYAC